MKKTIKPVLEKKQKSKKENKYFNRGNTNYDFQQLKKFKINQNDPDIDNSIHSMNITQLKKFALLKGIPNISLKNIDRDELINLIEWPSHNIKIPNVVSNSNLTNDEQLRLISSHVEKLNEKFKNILNENAQLKELLGTHQFDHHNKKRNIYYYVSAITIFLLVVSLITILIIKK